MTGFGGAAGPVGEAQAEIWARSVNHRSLDLTVRVKESEAALEPALRRAFARRLARGKVDVTLRWKRAGAGGYDVTFSEELLRSVLARLAAVSESLSLAAQLQARDVLAIPQIFSVETAVAEFTPEEVSTVEALADAAASELVAMR